MDVKQVLADFQDLVDVEVEAFFEAERPKAAAISPVASQALERLAQFCLRPGKRLRPALLYYGYKLFDGDNDEEAIRAAICPEILHAYLLVHDDVMDQDAVRRGEPTMHEIYADEHRRLHKSSKWDNKHFGESMAINVGDVACHYALQALAATKFPAAKKVAAIQKLHEQIVTVGYGQMLDVMSTVLADDEVDSKYVMQVHQFKTAVYTYETPLMIGATLAGAKAKDMEVLSKYAIPAGIAFQIQDDILGMFGDEEKLGKANISDLREGKHTLLIIDALAKATKDQKEIIHAALGNPNVTQEMADEVRQIVRDTGALQNSINVAKEYVKQAKKALTLRRQWQNQGRHFLDAIADHMINREF